MTETDTFYRWHGAHAPALSADNAWSGLWGGTYTADGSAMECPSCDGTGVWLGEPCPDCDGEGQQECQEGYSCCDSAEELASYFAEHLGGDPGDGEVVVFSGARTGTGFDGEPLAVPTRIIRQMTWAQLLIEAAAG